MSANDNQGFYSLPTEKLKYGYVGTNSITIKRNDNNDKKDECRNLKIAPCGSKIFLKSNEKKSVCLALYEKDSNFLKTLTKSNENRFLFRLIKKNENVQDIRNFKNLDYEIIENIPVISHGEESVNDLTAQDGGVNGSTAEEESDEKSKNNGATEKQKSKKGKFFSPLFRKKKSEFEGSSISNLTETKSGGGHNLSNSDKKSVISNIAKHFDFLTFTVVGKAYKDPEFQKDLQETHQNKEKTDLGLALMVDSFSNFFQSKEIDQQESHYTGEFSVKSNQSSTEPSDSTSNDSSLKEYYLCLQAIRKDMMRSEIKKDIEQVIELKFTQSICGLLKLTHGQDLSLPTVVQLNPNYSMAYGWTQINSYKNQQFFPSDSGIVLLKADASFHSLKPTERMDLSRNMTSGKYFKFFTWISEGKATVGKKAYFAVDQGVKVLSYGGFLSIKKVGVVSFKTPESRIRRFMDKIRDRKDNEESEESKGLHYKTFAIIEVVVLNETAKDQLVSLINRGFHKEVQISFDKDSGSKDKDETVNVEETESQDDDNDDWSRTFFICDQKGFSTRNILPREKSKYKEVYESSVSSVDKKKMKKNDIEIGFEKLKKNFGKIFHPRKSKSKRAMEQIYPLPAEPSFLEKLKSVERTKEFSRVVIIKEINYSGVEYNERQKIQKQDLPFDLSIKYAKGFSKRKVIKNLKREDCCDGDYKTAVNCIIMLKPKPLCEMSSEIKFFLNDGQEFVLRIDLTTKILFGQDLDLESIEQYDRELEACKYRTDNPGISITGAVVLLRNVDKKSIHDLEKMMYDHDRLRVLKLYENNSNLAAPTGIDYSDVKTQSTTTITGLVDNASDRKDFLEGAEKFKLNRIAQFGQKEKHRCLFMKKFRSYPINGVNKVIWICKRDGKEYVVENEEEVQNNEDVSTTSLMPQSTEETVEGKEQLAEERKNWLNFSVKYKLEIFKDTDQLNEKSKKCKISRFILITMIVLYCITIIQ